jgi:hypothetical protein
VNDGLCYEGVFQSMALGGVFLLAIRSITIRDIMIVTLPSYILDTTYDIIQSFVLGAEVLLYGPGTDLE